jgi:hypothetical protein
VRIGLVPKLPLARIVSAGNVAGEGAKIVALSVQERARGTRSSTRWSTSSSPAAPTSTTCSSTSCRSRMSDDRRLRALALHVRADRGAPRLGRRDPCAAAAAAQTVPSRSPPRGHGAALARTATGSRFAVRRLRHVTARSTRCSRARREAGFQGDHCYDVLARDEVRDALAEEPALYFLTDFLEKTFDSSVARPLRLPELRGRLLRQLHACALAGPGADARAARPGPSSAAEIMGLRLEVREVGYGGLERAARATRRIDRAMTDFPSSAKAVSSGAGIVGNSHASPPRRLGWRDLVLLDKGALPNPGGSTGHASNFIFPVDHSKEMTALTRDSARQYVELGVSRSSGGIEVARTQERMEELEPADHVVDLVGRATRSC